MLDKTFERVICWVCRPHDSSLACCGRSPLHGCGCLGSDGTRPAVDNSSMSWRCFRASAARCAIKNGPQQHVWYPSICHSTWNARHLLDTCPLHWLSLVIGQGCVTRKVRGRSLDLSVGMFSVSMGAGALRCDAVAVHADCGRVLIERWTPGLAGKCVLDLSTGRAVQFLAA